MDLTLAQDMIVTSQEKLTKILGSIASSFAQHFANPAQLKIVFLIPRYDINADIQVTFKPLVNSAPSHDQIAKNSKPYAFSSMQLQSGIFTINRYIIIGLVSSIITAAMGYGIRLILLNYLEYDVFTNLDNLIASLSYFCSLGAIRFVIYECLKENTFLMSYSGGPIPVSNNTAGSGSLPVGSNAAGYNSSMQAPNNSATVSYSAGPSSIPGTPNHSTTGISSSSAGDAPITNDRLNFLSQIKKKQVDVDYFQYQVYLSKLEYNEVLSTRDMYQAAGKLEQ